jgi:hypothetical protein
MESIFRMLREQMRSLIPVRGGGAREVMDEGDDHSVDSRSRSHSGSDDGAEWP